MNYLFHYEKLIEKRRQSCPPDYVEKHHIVPRCLGGSDKKSNLVKLTAREHFVAHLLLAKIYGGKLWGAVNRMMNSSVHNSRNYEWARKQFSQSITGNGNGRYNKTVSKVTRQKIGKANKGKVCRVKKILSNKVIKFWKQCGGRSKSDRQKKSIAAGGRQFKVLKDGKQIGIWLMQRECAKELGLYHQNIGKALRNRNPYKGYKFIWI